ncbi:MAG: hypothetical protein LLF76_03055 [Planctomycetaceae bacterium]|nr:hypothetical protein [Planctomycetaceae bacterium]
MQLVIQTTSQETARAVVKEHFAECSINNIKREFYGDGTDQLPGVKADVRQLKTDVKGLKDCKSSVIGFVRDKLVTPVVTAIVVAAAMAYVFGRPDAKADTAGGSETKTQVTDVRPR